MSILIKDMEMPKACVVCPCACEFDGSCHITGYKPTFTEWYEDGVKDCPLVEVPPHGRLIDADALMKMCGMAIDCYDCLNGEHGWCKRSQDAANICEAIEDAPTIIEAEEGER